MADSPAPPNPPRPREWQRSLSGTSGAVVAMDPGKQAELLLHHDRVLDFHETRLNDQGREIRDAEKRDEKIESRFSEMTAEFSAFERSVETKMAELREMIAVEVAKVRTAVAVGMAAVTLICTVAAIVISLIK